MSLAQRSVQSTTYNIISNIVQMVVLVVRSIILARLLAPEVFGIYTFAVSIVSITSYLPNFGMGSAILHRAPESEGEMALRVYFTLSLMFGFAWALILIGLGSLLTSGDVRSVLWVLTATEFARHLTRAARARLIKRVVFRRLALINVSMTVISSAVALWLAWHRFGIWSLVAINIVSAMITIIGFYTYRPVWRPHLGWSTEIVRYLISFGSNMLIANVLYQALDRIDDLWTGTFLGETSLGFYSRAYGFATYPRRILAAPLNAVTAGAYAELKDDRRRLSQAFFRVNSLLVRSGFLLAGVLALVAPEFIRLMIGAKWLPMLTAFRLMLVFTLLDPLKGTIAHLFVAVGYPEAIVRVRLIQLMTLVIGLFALGPGWGIAGVAAAVNVMLLVGIALMVWQARVHVQFSITHLFAVPTFALILGMLVGRAAITIPGVVGSDWRAGAIKVSGFCTLYVGTIFLLERDQLPMLLNTIRQLLPARAS